MEVFGFGFNGSRQLILDASDHTTPACPVWDAVHIVLQPEKLFSIEEHEEKTGILTQSPPSYARSGVEEQTSAKEQQSDNERETELCPGSLEMIRPCKKKFTMEQIAIGWDRILYCLKAKDSGTVSLLQHGAHRPQSTKSDCGPSTCLRKDAKDVAISWKHTYVVTDEGRCMVSDNSAEEPKFQLVNLPSETGVDQCKTERVVAGEKHVVSLLGEGQVGMVEHDLDRDEFICRPLNLQLKVKAVSCGKEHVLMLTGIGVVLSMGIGGQGQLGHGDAENRAQPATIQALQGVSMMEVAAGGWHSLALSDIGDVYTWGWNERGQLGMPCKFVREQKNHSLGSRSSQGQVGDVVNIQAVPGVLDITDDGQLLDTVAISAGSRHTAVISETGMLFTWGWNQYGQLGHGHTVSCDQPTVVKYFKDKGLSVRRVQCGWWNTVVQAEPSEVVS